MVVPLVPPVLVCVAVAVVVPLVLPVLSGVVVAVVVPLVLPLLAGVVVTVVVPLVLSGQSPHNFGHLVRVTISSIQSDDIVLAGKFAL